MEKHFAIVELNSDNKNNMIGTITNVYNTEQSLMSFKERFLTAIGEHFDIDDFNFDEIPNLFEIPLYCDITIEIDGFNFEVRIQETWLY